MTPEIAELIRQTAQSLGIDPLDLGTAISYETAGSFDPTKRGPTTKWGQHRGFIQFGEPQARQYGVDWANPVASQLGPDGAVAKYLRDTGVKPGMGLLDVYSAINAGGVGRYDRSDAAAGGAPGTVADKVNNQMSGHRQKAAQLLGMKPGDPAPAFGPAREVAERPVATPGQGAPMAVAEGQGGGGLAQLFANLAPEPVQQPKMLGGASQMEDQASFGSGDPMGATMAAMQGAQNAQGLTQSLLPDIDALMAMGRKKPVGVV